MRLRNQATLAMAVMVLGIATPASAWGGNLVTNGSFETGDFTGWTLFGPSGGRAVQESFLSILPEDGSYQAVFGYVGGLNGVSQGIATDVGQSYDISFYLANLGGDPNEYVVQFGSTVLTDVIDAPEFSYTQLQFVATATSSLTTISFAFRQDPSWFLLDNVVVTSAVPEPSTLTLSGIASLIGLIYGVRPRKRKRDRSAHGNLGNPTSERDG
jgi:hypothetical protein